jgi:hypothetical protein
MNPKHPAWWVLPIFGIMVGLRFRPSEGIVVTTPDDQPVERRLLVLPDGRAMRFLRGPGMSVFLSETEVPTAWLSDVQSVPFSHAEAMAYAEALSTLTGNSLRLPTVEEWRDAARAGVASAEFAWGFGPAPDGSRIRFQLPEPPDTPGSAFGYGFRDLAGGMWEWTLEGTLLGSAWSESNPETLRIDHAWSPPPGYRGADAGIRLAWEPL